jgi:hypothetical protein
VPPLSRPPAPPSAVAGAKPGLRVAFEGNVYAGEEVARGAAYELFSPEPEPGFLPCPGGGAARWHRFVHATEVTALYGVSAPPDADPPDTPLQAPLSRALGWADVHRLGQTPARGGADLIGTIRRTAIVRRGTRMMKVLSAHQLGGYLRGWLPAGFCYREYDIAHLRTPAALRLLRTDADAAGAAGTEAAQVAYALRWRAVDPVDYELPTAAVHGGLMVMPPHDRVGPPVLGTGFTPSEHHMLPEFTTAEMADLPLTANAMLLAYTADGTEVVLYTYQPELRGWLRMVGRQWLHLLPAVEGVTTDQEYVPAEASDGRSRFIGRYRGQEYEAVADPPAEFRVLAMTRAARYPVESLLRRTRFTRWRGARCTVVRESSAWVRVRLCRPDPAAVAALGARCYERGVYETWAPAAELAPPATVDTTYPMGT